MSKEHLPIDVKLLYTRIVNLDQELKIIKNLELLNEVLDSLNRNKKYEIFDIIIFVNSNGHVERWVIMSEYLEDEIRKDGWSYDELFKNFYKVTWNVLGCKQLSFEEYEKYCNEIAKQGYKNTLVIEKD